MTTELVNDRNLGLTVGYLATDWTKPVDYSVYEDRLSDWVVMAVMRDQEPLGAMYYRDGEIHFSILPEWRRKWLTKGLLVQLLGLPRLITRVTPGHEYMYDVLAKVGFQRDGDLLVRDLTHGD